MKPFKWLALTACVIMFALPVCTADGFPVRVSAYAADPRCTKRVHPDITASMHRITWRDYHHLIALPPRFWRRYRFGDCFYLEVDGRMYLVRYEDRMPRNTGRVDFLLPSYWKCKEFGVHRGNLIPIGKASIRPPPKGIPRRVCRRLRENHGQRTRPHRRPGRLRAKKSRL